jgi:hypothetical protein
MPGKPLTRDWLHCNSVGYNAASGHIVINSVQGELYVVDHDGTFVAREAKAGIARAAGPAGDFLYRFGDPARYAQGEPPRILENWDSATSGHKQMGGSHDAHWVPAGLIGSSGQRLPNGNTFICSDTEGHLFEVTPEGKLAWKYINPVTRDGAVKALGDVLPMTNSLFRAYRYAADHPALKGRDLTPNGTITERAAKGLDPSPRRPPRDRKNGISE